MCPCFGRKKMTPAHLMSWVDWERIWNFCQMIILQLQGEKEQNLTIKMNSRLLKIASNTPLEENDTLTVRLRCQMMIIIYVSKKRKNIEVSCKEVGGGGEGAQSLSTRQKRCLCKIGHL